LFHTFYIPRAVEKVSLNRLRKKHIAHALDKMYARYSHTCQWSANSEVYIQIEEKPAGLMMFFWVKVQSGLVGKSQRFVEACCLHLQG
jgi:hypothetical protein